MKSYLNCAILMAGLAGLGVSASYDSITATVPFSFRLNKTEMPAGEYSVRLLGSGSAVMMFYNQSAHKSSLVLTSPALSKSTDQQPRLIFQCGDEGCRLEQVWGAGSGGLQIPAPNDKPLSHPRLAVVYMNHGHNGD